MTNNRSHHESGEQNEERLHPDQQRRWHSSSSTSWWDKSEWNWKWEVQTDTPHTRVFLDMFDLVRTSHCGSRCRSVCLTKITHAHVITCLTVCCFLALSSSSPSRASTFSLNCQTCSLSCSSTSMWSKPSRNKTTALTHNEGVLPRGDTQPFSHVMSPNSSTTSTSQRLKQRSSRMNPST